jgi:prolyl-tRNA synthetase
VVTRWTELGLTTLREAPSGIATERRRLLVRAGLMDPGPSGTYRWTPLGQRLVGRLEERLAWAGLEGGHPREVLTALGLDCRAVAVASLPDDSAWLYPCPDGPDEVLACPACPYAGEAPAVPCGGPTGASRSGSGSRPGNLRAATAPAPRSAGGAAVRRHTPGVRTIADLERFSGVPAARQIKTLFYAIESGPPVGPGTGTATDRTLVAALVRGDRTLSEVKLLRAAEDLAGAVPFRVAPADREEVLRAAGAPFGSAGPVGLRGVPVVADAEVMALSAAACGANEEDYHFFEVEPGRDFVPHLVSDLREAVPGDPCPECGTATLDPLRGLLVIGDGPGVKAGPGDLSWWRLRPGPLVEALAEAGRDEAGLAWPPGGSPFDVVVIPVDTRDPAQAAAAARVAADLEALGVDVLLDDRDARPGVKFTDADLVGFPVRVTVGPRRLAEGQVEVTRRRTRETRAVPLTEAAREVALLLGGG